MMSESMRPNLVTDAQRDRAVDYLQRAYANGALEAEEFDERLSQALTASTRSELNSSLRGIARIAETPSMAMAPAPVAMPPVPVGVQNVGSGLVHLAGLPTGFIGPAIVKAAATPGSRLWWEASRAMSWQISSLLGFIAVVIGSIVLDMAAPIFLAGLAWFVGTVVFSVRAFNGEDSTGRLGHLMLFGPKAPPRR
ncbi:DUF1707 and DUF4870 domain-containing protein [Tessaracoccus sp. OS52]|uniref:DUF1707 domain-containing protein n=1 Tax=Tessaracoccus sp. OS52 TaxID=2886691 RepID=UPI001D0F51B1|nr:DUF1707 domain-containing protein [Tessaracoccus sp. OS52]MCC2592780.1 DUF1707 and DUF4870 domain-containing protein [Tessaracoccus sp. OS52]